MTTEPFTSEIHLTPHGVWTYQILDAEGNTPQVVDGRLWWRDIVRASKMLAYLGGGTLIIVHPEGYGR